MLITNEDNIKLMARYEDNYFDLAIVDPPYRDSNQPTKDMRANGSMKSLEGRPSKEYWSELNRVSKEQIIWGANYMIDKIKKPSMGWIYWDKMNGSSDFSDGELAYTSFERALRSFKYHLSKDRCKRFHPTQKPVQLYEWLLMVYAKEGDKILDTHLGSGSIASACHNLGFDLTACELDKEYYEAAMKRIKEHQSQLRII